MYHYTGIASDCKIKKERKKYPINSYIELPKDEMKLMAWLKNKGPISIVINSNTMHFYKGGIDHPSERLCSREEAKLNHFILLVGYGKANGTPYWIAKNSWGTNWGEQGYYRVFRGENTCGLANIATSALLNPIDPSIVSKIQPTNV